MMVLSRNKVDDRFYLLKYLIFLNLGGKKTVLFVPCKIILSEVGYVEVN